MKFSQFYENKNRLVELQELANLIASVEGGVELFEESWTDWMKNMWGGKKEEPVAAAPVATKKARPRVKQLHDFVHGEKVAEALFEKLAETEASFKKMNDKFISNDLLQIWQKYVGSLKTNIESKIKEMNSQFKVQSPDEFINTYGSNNAEDTKEVVKPIYEKLSLPELARHLESEDSNMSDPKFKLSDAQLKEFVNIYQRAKSFIEDSLTNPELSKEVEEHQRQKKGGLGSSRIGMSQELRDFLTLQSYLGNARLFLRAEQSNLEDMLKSITTRHFATVARYLASARPIVKFRFS